MIVFRLAEVAQEKGFTKTKLHRAADITYPAVLRLWKSKDIKQIDTSVLNKLCKALNCTPGDLIKWVPESTKS